MSATYKRTGRPQYWRTGQEPTQVTFDMVVDWESIDRQIATKLFRNHSGKCTMLGGAIKATRKK